MMRRSRRQRFALSRWRSRRSAISAAPIATPSKANSAAPAKNMSLADAFSAVELLVGEAEPGERLNLAFLGGEPLVNRPSLQAAARRARELGEARGATVNYSITTNGTLLTEDDARFFEDFGFAVTISLDGPKEVHDALRPYKGGGGSFDATMRRAAPLLRLQRKMQVSARVTVTPRNLSLRRTLDTFVDAGFHSVGFSPMLSSPNGQGELQSDDLELMLGEMIDCGREYERRSRLGERYPFANMANALREIHRGTHRPYPCGAGAGYLGVSADGELVRLPSLRRRRGRGDGLARRTGSIRRAKRKWLAERHVHRQEPCRSCWARYLCGGGCHHEVLQPRPACLRLHSRLAALLPRSLSEAIGAAGRESGSNRSGRRWLKSASSAQVLRAQCSPRAWRSSGTTSRLIEQAGFPRSRLGESLSPGVRPLLAAARLETALDDSQRPTRIRNVSVNWEDGLAMRIDTREQGLDCRPRRLRPRLGRTRPRIPASRSSSPRGSSTGGRSGGRWRLAVEVEGAERRSRPTSGGRRRTQRGAAARPRASRPARQTLAIYAYWRGRAPSVEPRIEAGDEAWFWGVPLPNGAYNALAFVDPKSFRAGAAGLAERFLARLAQSPLMEDCRHARLIGAPRADRRHALYRSGCVGRELRSAWETRPWPSIRYHRAACRKRSRARFPAPSSPTPFCAGPTAADLAIGFYLSQLSDASESGTSAGPPTITGPSPRPWRPFWRALAGVGPRSRRAVARGRRRPSMMTAMAFELSPDAAFVETPCLDGEFVSAAPALRHPRLARPVAYLGGRELASLLRIFPPGRTPLQIARSWSNRMPLESGLAIAGWLVNHGVLVRIGAVRWRRGRADLDADRLAEVSWARALRFAVRSRTKSIWRRCGF